jgi:hypothetical protein
VRAGDRLSARFRLRALFRLFPEIRFGLGALRLGFELTLLGKRTGAGCFRGARFGRGACFRDRFGGAFRLAPRSQLLLSLPIGGETLLSALERLLVRGGTALRRRLRFGFGLLPCLRFLDRAQVRRDPRLRALLRLLFHFGTLKRKPRGRTVRFGARGQLSGAGAFGSPAGAGRGESAALGFERVGGCGLSSGCQHAHARHFGVRCVSVHALRWSLLGRLLSGRLLARGLALAPQSLGAVYLL